MYLYLLTEMPKGEVKVPCNDTKGTNLDFELQVYVPQNTSQNISVALTDGR